MAWGRSHCPALACRRAEGSCPSSWAPGHGPARRVSLTGAPSACRPPRAPGSVVTCGFRPWRFAAGLPRRFRAPSFRACAPARGRAPAEDSSWPFSASPGASPRARTLRGGPFSTTSQPGPVLHPSVTSEGSRAGSRCRDSNTWSPTGPSGCRSRPSATCSLGRLHRVCWVGDPLQSPSPCWCAQGDACRGFLLEAHPGSCARRLSSRHPRPALALPWEQHARPLWNAGAVAVGGSRRLASCYKKLWRRRPAAAAGRLWL